MFASITFGVAAAAYVLLIAWARRDGRLSGIGHHPYGNPYDDAPGARALTKR